MSPSGIYGYILGQDPVFTSLAWCKIRTAFGQIFGLWSAYTICFVTFDQYLSTNHRYSIRQMSTLKLAYRLTLFNICFWILHSILFFTFEDIQSTFGCGTYNLLLKQYFSFFYYPILSSALPLITTTSFSLLAYHNVRCLIRRQIPVVRRRLNRQLTAMVLARVICLVVLGVPYIIYSLYQLNLKITGNNYMEIAIATLTGEISYSLIYANFSISFYVFLFISLRFHRQVKHFLVTRCSRLFKWLCVRRLIDLRENQVAPEIDQRVVCSVIST